MHSHRSGTPPLLLLIIGSALVFMTFMRLSVPAFAWIVFAPFLVVLHERRAARPHRAVLAALVLSFLAAISKMATPEIPWAPPVPMFAIPIAASYFAALAAASRVHRRVGPRAGVYTFASMVVVLGWLQYTFTPASSWGILAHTQLDNLPLVQLAAITGVGGLTFLVALGSALSAAAWSSGIRAVRADIAVFAALLIGAFVYGHIRLTAPAPGEPVRIGSVVSPVTHHDFHNARSGIDTLRALDSALFARTERAADLGATVIVWNEMATLVTPDGELALAERGRALAMRRGVMLVMAYGVFTSLQPLHDVNKYRVYLPDGTLADEYVKRHPVPGDPDEHGANHASIVAFGGVMYSGAICYDYGFPHIARDNALDGATIALVPSSDWHGIDPEHGRMALMNAVAVGLPMVRPVRAATSIATDQYGRLLGSMRADGAERGVMVTAVPTARVRTLYAETGEFIPLAALLMCIVGLLRTARRSAQT